MLKPIAIAVLAAALIATGAYAPQAHVKSADSANLTVVEKNQFWPQPGTRLELCDLSRCQDV
jgi:hypothetical protein